MAQVRIFLISGHMTIIDQPKIELNDSTKLITYGKVGENNLNSDFVKVENMFFMNNLPRDVSAFKYILPTLSPETSHKKFKLQSDTYHDVSITLCSYVYVNEHNQPCNTEEEAVRVELFLSGIYEMNDININTEEQARDYVSRKHVTIYQEYNVNAVKQFFVTKRNAVSLYSRALIKRDLLYTLFGNKNRITLKKFIEKSKDNLSNILRGLPDDNKICILDGCRDYYGDSYEDRVDSSASENSMSESSGSQDDHIVMQPVMQPVIQHKAIRKNTLQKPKLPKGSRVTEGSSVTEGSRVTKGKNDSLLNIGTKPKSRITKGKHDSLLMNAGKTRKKKRKNNHK
jgi:hypothetical protein